MVKGYVKEFEKALGSKKTINLVFLGIGLTLFVINVSSMLAFLPSSYNSTAFVISVFSSIIIILVAVWNLQNSH